MIRNSEILVSTDKSKLDLEMIHRFLTTSYWATGRTLDQVKVTVDNSICFGVYLDNRQIGFARVLSDRVAFAYLMDVFILEEFRGKGYSITLLKEVFSHSSLKNVSKWLLGTTDARDLYKKFGFTKLSHPERLMEYKKDNI